MSSNTNSSTYYKEIKIASMNFTIFLNILGSAVVVSSSSWFSMWMGLEITSMTAPSIISHANSSLVSKVNCWKYYMIQCYSSCIFFTCILCLSNSSFNSSLSNFYWMMIFISMILKMGVFPFHGWLLQISHSLPWTVFLIFSTIQKIGPLVVISECFKALSKTFLIDLLMALTMSMFSILGILVYSVRFFMINSSIINVAWMISSAQTSKLSFSMFIFFYFMHLFNLFIHLSKEFTNPLESLTFLKKKVFLFELMKLFTILSLIGMPPTVGFFMKMSIVEQLILMKQYFTSSVLIFSSSIIMIMYLKMIIITISNMRIEEIQQFKLNLSISSSILFVSMSSLFYLL